MRGLSGLDGGMSSMNEFTVISCREDLDNFVYMCYRMTDSKYVLVLSSVFHNFSSCSFDFRLVCVCVMLSQLIFSPTQGEEMGDCWRHVPPHLQVGPSDGAQIR